MVNLFNRDGPPDLGRGVSRPLAGTDVVRENVYPRLVSWPLPLWAGRTVTVALAAAAGVARCTPTAVLPEIPVRSCVALRLATPVWHRAIPCASRPRRSMLLAGG